MSTAVVHTIPAFDEIAEIYDEVFTHSLVGTSQRGSVWEEIDGLWKPGDRVLELNCGTGEDALHLAGKGISVTGCDASPAMIEVANQKKARRRPRVPVRFVVLPNEYIGGLLIDRRFDGVFSNFSGLNCVADLANVAQQLATLLRPGAEVALVFSTPFSLWESLWYGVRGDWAKAIRRWSGHVSSTISGVPVEVWYPRVSEIRQAFAPWFWYINVSGIGVAVPPSYVESLAQKHSRIFSLLRTVDRLINHLPLFRVMGDHMLLRFRRSS
ncbi:MAG: methyltransferase domain-containing protein [Terriglobia bacterium]|nr:methyltransferase domain-containing protein [Terriglobia bacterium]